MKWLVALVLLISLVGGASAQTIFTGYYKLRNVQADTEMRSSIARTSPVGAKGGGTA